MRFTLLLGLIALFPASLDAQVVQLPEPLRQVGFLHLEETADVLVAQPNLALDPRGGWLYWDTQSQDARLYSDEGDLLASFGGPGDGPGEFERLLGLVRIGDGRLVTLESRGRLAVWSESGDSLLFDRPSGVTHPVGMAAYGDSQLVIYARATVTDPSDHTVPVLFEMDVDDSIRAEPIFEARLSVIPPIAIENPPPVVHADSVTIAQPPFDSLWTVSLNAPFGHRSAHIEAEALAASPEPVGLEAGRPAVFEWMYSARFPGRFGHTPEGAWILQVWGVGRDDAPPHNSLVRIDTDGRQLWEAEGRWNLLTVSPNTGELYLWDPEGLDPAAIVIAEDDGEP